MVDLELQEALLREFITSSVEGCGEFTLSKGEFKTYPDRSEFWYDGDRIFSLKNITLRTEP